MFLPVMHKLCQTMSCRAAQSLSHANLIWQVSPSQNKSVERRNFNSDFTIHTTLSHMINYSQQVRNMSSSTEEVLFKEIESKGVVTLNRPKALNALTEVMIRAMFPVLKKWEDSKKLVIIKGSGEKAFCAGGDIRALTTTERRNDPTVAEFFRVEYTLNNLIGTYQIPYVAFITGVVMGGGCGVSINGQYRVASDKSMFAMPETAIGLFPDVGGSHFLPRLGGGLGMFLALTGHRLRGADLLLAGLATHFCPESRLGELEEALLALQLTSSSRPEQSVAAVLDTFTQQQHTADFSLAPHLQDIAHCFTAPTLTDLLQRLQQGSSEFCQKQLSLIQRMSPTSVVITHELIKRGVAMNLQECLKMEFRLVNRILEDTDFSEGVRALLVDKDNKPSWKPASLEDINGPATIDRYFAALPEDRELAV